MLTQEKAEQIAQSYSECGFKKTQALLTAGYALSYARSLGHKLYDNIKVKAALAKIKADNKVKSEITTKYVIDKLKIVAERCMQEIPVLDNDGKETGEYQFKETGANKALELLGRHTGAWELDNKQRQAQLQIAIKAEQVAIDAALAKALEAAPDAMVG